MDPWTPEASTITITPGADVQEEPSTRPATIYIPIPQFGVRASAGKGQLVTDESINGYLALEDTFLRSTLGRRREDLVGIEAAGDSMEPNIQDGDLLVVDTTVQDIQSSRVYVLDINGELLVKRLSLRLDGQCACPIRQPQIRARDRRPKRTQYTPDHWSSCLPSWTTTLMSSLRQSDCFDLRPICLGACSNGFV